MTGSGRPAFFVDADRQRTFEEQGYVQLHLLDQATVDQLATIGARYIPHPGHTFNSSIFLPDIERRIEFSNLASSLIAPFVDRHLQNHRVLGSVYLLKGTGPDTKVGLHQAPTLVDETRHVYAEIWMPLVESGLHNGTLHVLPGSHRRFRGLRAPTLPHDWPTFEPTLWPLMRPLIMNAGEAVIIDAAVVHGSPANLSKEYRNAVLSGACSRDAQALFFYRDPEGETDEVEKFAMEPDFALQFRDVRKDYGARPAFGRSLGMISHRHSPIHAADVDAFVRSV